MTISFENNNKVIVYALEKIIQHARRTQQIFVAQCVWWLASIIGLEQGLIIYIDNLRAGGGGLVQQTANMVKDNISISELESVPSEVPPGWRHQATTIREVSSTPRDRTEDQRLPNSLLNSNICDNIHPDQVQQVIGLREVSATPRDHAEEQRLHSILERTEHYLEGSTRLRNQWELNRVNPLPQTTRQLMKARKFKQLQKAGMRKEAERNQRLKQIRNLVIQNLSKE